MRLPCGDHSEPTVGISPRNTTTSTGGWVSRSNEPEQFDAAVSARAAARPWFTIDRSDRSGRGRYRHQRVRGCSPRPGPESGDQVFRHGARTCRVAAGRMAAGRRSGGAGSGRLQVRHRANICPVRIPGWVHSVPAPSATVIAACLVSINPRRRKSPSPKEHCESV